MPSGGTFLELPSPNRTLSSIGNLDWIYITDGTNGSVKVFEVISMNHISEWSSRRTPTSWVTIRCFWR